MPATLLALLQHLGTDDVGRHQVGGELHPLLVEAEDAAEIDGKLGLGEARGAHQQRMTAAENGRQGEADDLVLAVDDPAHRLAHPLQPVGRGVKVVEDPPVRFVDAVHGRHYNLQVSAAEGARAERPHSDRPWTPGGNCLDSFVSICTVCGKRGRTVTGGPPLPAQS